MSSYRNSPRRDSHAIDLSAANSNINRNNSTTSSASSGYSYTSDHSIHSQSTSASSIYGSVGHKRGQSDVISRARLFETGDSSSAGSGRGQDNIYGSVRQSLRPLPRTPTASSIEAPATPPHGSKQPRERGQSIDIGRLSLSQNDSVASPTVPSRPLPARPNSIAHIARPDLERLGRSSTSQLRTLSQLAKSEDAEDFKINSPAQEVVGLRGRRRLQRTDKTAGRAKTNYGWEGRNWMDKQRRFLQAYEYLCHIGEAKEWIEDVIQQTLPPIVELEEALRDGVTLAEVVESLNPERRFRIFRNPKLQFRHSDNIAIFFRYLDEVELPDLFRFELIDLYEKKNIPKVIYCIHALSWLLFRKGIVDFRIGNLIGQLEFEHHELEAMQKGLDMLGVNMPSFGNMGADFGVPEPEPEPEPEETEEERIERELAENEDVIIDFQAQLRGALLRLKLGEMMQGFWDEEQWLIDLQSRIRGNFTREIMNYRMQMRQSAILVQSLVRGFLVRKGLKKSDQARKAAEPAILAFQSMLRAQKARNEMQGLKSTLSRCDAPIRAIQAMSKGFLLRQSQNVQQQETKKAAKEVQNLQALARGMLTRYKISKDLCELEEHTPMVASLQAAVRATLVRARIEQQQQDLQSFTDVFTSLQSAIRGRAARDEQEVLKAELANHVPAIGQLQAAMRAAAVRREITTRLDDLKENEPAVIELQAHIRAMFERQKVLAIQDQLDAEEPAIIDLQSHIRGFLCRQYHYALLDELSSHDAATAEFQAILKAMMERARIDDLLTELLEEEDSIVIFQAAAKAFLIRLRFEEKKRFYEENMKKVIKIQSFVRAKVQGEAYKSLTTGKNPPVSAVKNFVHLLNDSDFDFNEEVEFERMRKTVVQHVRQNEMLEQYIDQLDIKIALLVKNKITLDEVVRHQHTFGGTSMGLLANSTIASTNQFDLKALNKSSRKKLESYQQLFFSLQTQPHYLARLFKHIRVQVTAEKDSRRIELLMMSLFGYAQKRREEYYLLKLIARSIREEVESTTSALEYSRGHYFWTKLLANYTRSPRDRKYLRSLLGPLIRDNIIEDPALDLESDPMQIYRSAINNEELRTGRPDHRPLDVPREVAIRDPETRRLFIDHLRDLREICDQLFSSLEEQVHKMPYGLRFVCSEMFQALRQHFTREPPENLLQMVSHWLWKFYLQPAVTMPENVGVIDKSLSPLQKRNLGEVAKVVGQIALGRPFGGENIYLQPLNAFIGESIERLQQITNDLINVPDAERTFDIDEFNDLYAKNKPTLYVKMSDVFAIHNLVAQELMVMAPTRDDVLREIMQDLGSAKSNESEMSAAGSADIQMFLTPRLHDLEDPEADIKALFMETKRCVLYIIRVQTGANLLEILVKQITVEDEEKWEALLREDFADTNSRGAYSDTKMADITSMSYYDLKRTALENIMQLEQMGRISKQNQYQDVLNAIASDIRTQSRRRVQRQRELDGVRLTLANLTEKAKYLEQQRKSYDDYIEQSMKTLQNKKGRKRFLMPFTKQYNHQRELERSGRVPKFGSYKYSARALSEKGVLVSWSGTADREWDKIDITISCDQVGVFAIEGTRSHIQIPGATAQVPIEDMLQAQFEAHQFMTLFEGTLKLNVNLLLHLIYRKFYRTQ
ncbi:GTPase-activator protein for ras-like GTPase domain-containing protein [Trichoderma breve]|uniref:GTPase-activator protein for ras-like GTPase domain-containing protein n=1 Tax=Trichoderma breve TaxID=2034170 RepID=A0A9W9E7Z6_9HYPO|nr:GTPase-activator protein for ras-like GTPase domain-containing protein [Trichoderma breve]KAJ4862383.1 GTPase-activator protein for ras-like GTPase domain-containing protein [Trichoderma breve]